MGDVVVIAYLVLALLATGLLVAGLATKRAEVTLAGIALLVAAAAAWIAGPPAVLAGLAVFVVGLLWIRRPAPKDRAQAT